MKFRKLKSTREMDVNIIPYMTDWNHKVSKPQKAVKDFLHKYWKGEVVLEEFMIPGSKLRIDIMNVTRNPRIVIEVSPEATHTKFNKFMHGTRQKFTSVYKRDIDKLMWAEESGYLFIELDDNDIANNLNEAYFLSEYGITL